jgi:hypothetical protein
VNTCIDLLAKSYLRSLLLVSVLLTLCISEGVGLQLLPIPNVATPVLPNCDASLIEARTDVPGPLPRGKSNSGRVEIVAPKFEGPSHEQLTQYHTAIIPTVQNPDVSFLSPTFSSRELPSGYTGILISQEADRAPPLPA